MKRRLFVSVATIAFSASSAHAQLVGGTVVVCTNCSQEVNDAIRWAQSLAHQIREITYQFNTWTNLLTNTLSLPQRLLNDLTAPLGMLRGLASGAGMYQQQIKFMIDNLGHPSGYGGSLNDIPYALAQENNALALAGKQLGLVQQQANTISDQCAQQHASTDLASFDAPGIKSAAQAGNTIAATSGQCAEAHLQVQAAGWNVMAAAQLRQAERQTVLDAASQQHLQTSITAGCSSLAAGGGGAPWFCNANGSPGAAGVTSQSPAASYVTTAPGTVAVANPGGSGSSGTTASTTSTTSSSPGLVNGAAGNVTNTSPETGAGIMSSLSIDPSTSPSSAPSVPADLTAGGL